MSNNQKHLVIIVENVDIPAPIVDQPKIVQLVIHNYVAFKAVRAKKIGLVAAINGEKQGVSVRQMVRSEKGNSFQWPSADLYP
jgi:hypothetical protein